MEEAWHDADHSDGRRRPAAGTRSSRHGHPGAHQAPRRAEGGDPGAGDPEAEAPEHHEPILNALARAYHWQRLLDEGRMTSGVEIARQEGLNQSSVNELLRLTLLSPRIVRALLAGRQPKTLTLRWLKNHELPADWEAQREVFGALDR
jgi:hypothetical protein